MTEKWQTLKTMISAPPCPAPPPCREDAEPDSKPVAADFRFGAVAELEHGATDGIAIHQPPLPGFAVGCWTLGIAINFRYRLLAYLVGDTRRYAFEEGRCREIYADHGLIHGDPERGGKPLGVSRADVRDSASRPR